jgi:hypothetical protein
MFKPKKVRTNYHRAYYIKNRDKLLLSAKLKHKANMEQKSKLIIDSESISNLKKLNRINEQIIISFD